MRLGRTQAGCAVTARPGGTRRGVFRASPSSCPGPSDVIPCVGCEFLLQGALSLLSEVWIRPCLAV